MLFAPESYNSSSDDILFSAKNTNKTVDNKVTYKDLWFITQTRLDASFLLDTRNRTFMVSNCLRNPDILMPVKNYVHIRNACAINAISARFDSKSSN